MESNLQYKGMIGLDLDGTTLDPDKHVRPRVRQAVERAIRCGYLVVPATGRPVRGLSREFMAIPGITHAITANGAVLVRIRNFEAGDWTEISQDPLPEETVWKVLHILESYDVIPDCFIGGHGNMPLYAQERIPHMGFPDGIVRYLLADRSFHPDFYAFVRSHPGETVKITVNFDLTTDAILSKPDVLEALRSLPGILIVSGAAFNLEICRDTAGKGTGLLKLCDLLGISRANTMGCGDEGNDLDLIRKAAFGVAVANASPELLSAADHITGSNLEDGVADAIDLFLLRQEPSSEK